MNNLYDKNDQSSGAVIWITGLSGAGKTTLAQGVADKLRLSGRAVVLLDGDVLRDVLGANTNHSSVSRLEIAKKYSGLCKILASQGIIVVIATISLFREIHVWNRDHLPRYIEVYLKVPLSELERRDPKGIYQRFHSGKIKNVAGLDLEIHEPVEADWIEVFDPLRSSLMVCSDLLLYIEKELRDKNDYRKK
tara:strand:- start:1073 stop:1648 length:576 start_codon:yes stop_codon:yes gene_type:complete